ncbi:fatty acid--CoA ligase [Streptomyces sp. Ru73]|uniref:AMP-binding protein n=1 Tax=Streptomyces sp. Ru73 TaxID=2080748 RepID=UPI000CDD3863|nr:AMP-binding protein [Streptomyces sp. Ru73]POX42767.1 fatty acid--CoA ligase [Streptomyces sp. Ru73]
MPDGPAPAFRSYPNALLDLLSATPGRPVLTADGGLHVTAGELRDHTYRLARELAERGFGPGTTVALLTGNTPEALTARYAAHLAGARVVHLHNGLAPAVLARLAESTETTLLLIDSTRHTTAKGLLPLLAAPAVLGLGPNPFGEDVLAAAARREPHAFTSPVGPEDDLYIQHTGGTTGVPKGIRTTHGPYARGVGFPIADAGDPPRYLACTPLGRLAGFLTDKTLMQGGSVVLQHSFEPGAVLAAIARERITHVWLLPPQLHQLLDHPDLPATDLSSLTRITYGGSPSSAARLRQAADVFGPILYGWYAQSEAPAISEARPHEHTITGPGGRITVGRPLPGVDVAIRDEEGRTLPPGEEGEIQVRSPIVMSGYWRQPELTAKVLRDGWLRTGDIGTLNEDGYLFVVGRRDNVIIVVGGHVHPTEVEELLLSHPAVAQCAVFGARDADETERIHAAIVPAAGHSPTPEEIRGFVSTHKGRLCAPDAIHLLTELPLTPADKPDIELLRTTLATAGPVPRAQSASGPAAPLR